MIPNGRKNDQSKDNEDQASKNPLSSDMSSDEEQSESRRVSKVSNIEASRESVIHVDSNIIMSSGKKKGPIQI